MAHQISKWETDIGPKAAHDTLEQCVAAEMTHMLGSDGSEGSIAPALAKEMAPNPAAFINCLNQLTNGGVE
jgi:hypothetical protein